MALSLAGPGSTVPGTAAGSCLAKAGRSIGAATLAAVRATIAKEGLDALCAEFMTERLTFMASLPGWQHDGRGWARRLCRLPYQSRSMDA